MEREDDSAAVRADEDAVTHDHEHRGGPTQPGDEGFGQGAGEQTSEREPDFARGVDRDETPDPEHAEGRFSRGQEAPGTEEASEEGDFARGAEDLPRDRD